MFGLRFGVRRHIRLVIYFLQPEKRNDFSWAVMWSTKHEHMSCMCSRSEHYCISERPSFCEERVLIILVREDWIFMQQLHNEANRYFRMFYKQFKDPLLQYVHFHRMAAIPLFLTRVVTPIATSRLQRTWAWTVILRRITKNLFDLARWGFCCILWSRFTRSRKVLTTCVPVAR